MKTMKLQISQCHKSHPDYAGQWFVEGFIFAFDGELDELIDIAGPFAHRGTASKAATDCMTINPQVTMMAGQIESPEAY